MIEQQCYCAEVKYQVLSDYVPVYSEHDNLCFIHAVGLVNDPKKCVKKYVQRAEGAFEHAFCGQCGCPIYQINEKGEVKYCIWQTSTVHKGLYSGAMQFGL
ncbi:hypothetical protein J8L98_18385 [Pseudoalteromonas sp. MMG013]|uniref:hypothetical protein n=1 Tax=Pseudoalteromonas sp. MMG013 TaxID=2822687 RepID=UPI001B35A549|nr:hypothetical protein [Pseudoalteromonas sp. MMG013]MBQ4863652.1 hypothetical protein [Pseudoalteromonas sp. MMG013]